MPDPLGSFSYTWPFLAGLILAYLVGSIPFGLILTRLAGHGDLRSIGSGNIGATNVLRTGNKTLALLTLILDSGKGILSVLAAANFGPDMAVIAAGSVVIGHVFPVWLRFRGGKGVATVLGVLLAIAWPVGLAACVTWLLSAVLLRYSSLAALTAITLAPFYAWMLATPQIVELTLVLAALTILRHVGNIRRLLQGREPRIGGPSPSP